LSYFKSLPFIEYDFTVDSDPNKIVEVIPDITARAVLRITDENLEKICQKYMILDGETPEKIAYKFYGNPKLHWTILWINDIGNVNSEWPISGIALKDFCVRKYNDIYGLHHYEKLPEMLRMDNEFVVEQQALGNFGINELSEISNFEYEERKNELKRFIKLIDPLHISGFVAAFERAFVK